MVKKNADIWLRLLYMFTMKVSQRQAAYFVILSLRTERWMKSPPTLSTCVMWESCHSNSVVFECDMGQL